VVSLKAVSLRVPARADDPGVLLVSANPDLRSSLADSLSAAGFQFRELATAKQALAALRHEPPPDLILIDLDQPGLDGLKICARIRSFDSRVGIFILSRNAPEEDKIGWLEAGADDFVAKPIQIRELVARLRAIHRRQRRNRIPKLGVYRVGSLELDLTTRIFRKDGNPVRLTPKEFDLLAVLMENAGTPVVHRKLLQTVWGPGYGSETEYLRSYVKMLRKKIEDDPSQPAYILTEPWAGYRLQNPADPN
jgi:two-component system KDP operon response regulator KdpE